MVVVGIAPRSPGECTLYDGEVARTVGSISPYLTAGEEIAIERRREPISELSPMRFGNHPYYATDLMLTSDQAKALPKIAK